MTLQGIDISYAQGATPSLAGKAFCFVRTGYGSGSIDSRWASHSASVRGDGKVLGAYWFWYLNQDNAKAVAVFLANAGDAILALDLEGDQHDSAAGHAQARDFIARVHAAGRRIGLYHSASGYADLGQDFDWIADWGTEPARAWDFWQFGEVTIGGHHIDGDEFAGSASDLIALAGGLSGNSSGVDIMGLAVTLPAVPQAGSLVLPVGADSIRVSDGTHYKVPVAVGPRPAYVASLAAPYASAGFLVDLDGDTMHFIRGGQAGLVFSPTVAPATDCTAAVAAAVAPLNAIIKGIKAKVALVAADVAND